MTQTKENWKTELLYCFEKNKEPDNATLERLSNLVSGLLATQKAELRGKIEGMRVGGTTEYWNGYDQALADLLSLLDKQ